MRTAPLLGIDVGSCTVKAVWLNAAGSIVRVQSGTADGLRASILQTLQDCMPPGYSGLVRVGVTGQGRGAIATLSDVAAENELLALVRGLDTTSVQSVIEIGGHIARWVALKADGQGRQDRYLIRGARPVRRGRAHTGLASQPDRPKCRCPSG